MNINRPQNWPLLLANYAAEYSARPFEWGRNDCVLFAAGWLRVLGYPDPLAPFEAWRSPLSAARVIRASGGFATAIAERLAILGCPEIPIRTAQRGDLVLLQLDARRQALGIAAGNVAIAPGETNLSRLPIILHAVRAWSV